MCLSPPVDRPHNATGRTKKRANAACQLSLAAGDFCSSKASQHTRKGGSEPVRVNSKSLESDPSLSYNLRGGLTAVERIINIPAKASHLFHPLHRLLSPIRLQGECDSLCGWLNSGSGDSQRGLHVLVTIKITICRVKSATVLVNH